LPESTHNESELFLNPRADTEGSELWGGLSAAGSDAAIDEIACWSDYAETPLVRLPGQAARLGIAELHYKDESQVLGRRLCRIPIAAIDP
jgi:diaminopropionate ammonia-lyase